MAVLWDMDGTLVDTEPYWLDAEHEIVESAGGTWSQELGLELVGNDLMVSAALIRAQAALDWEPRRIVEELLVRVAARVRAHVPWRPGARALLDLLRAAGVPSALVTMSWRSVTDTVVDALPAGSFAAVVTGDEVTHGKPHPEPYLTAARLLGVEPGQCVAIEDSPTGVRSAVGAGVPTVAVPHIVPVPHIDGSVYLPSLQGITPADLLAIRDGLR